MPRICLRTANTCTLIRKRVNGIEGVPKHEHVYFDHEEGSMGGEVVVMMQGNGRGI
jgi:hypothetical protein